MNFGRDIAQGLSKSFQQVGAQAPQQMQNERAQMQQAALNMMHQRQQEAQFKEQQLLQQENQKRQQANIDRAFQAQEEQRKISNQLANDKFQFEQEKFKSPEQKLLDKENFEKEKKVRGILSIADLNKSKFLNNPELAKKVNDITQQASTEVADLKNSIFGTNLSNRITNRIPKELKDIESRGDIFDKKYRDTFLNSNFF